MKARIIAPVLAIAILTGGTAFGTFAFFADTETSTANIFTSGTLDLKTDDLDGVTATIADSSFVPGDTATGSVTLKRIGSITAADLDFTAEMAVTDDASAGDGTCAESDAMDKWIKVTALTYDGTDLLASVTDADGDGRKSLDDLEAHGAFTDQADPGTAGKVLQINVEYDTGAPNCNMADSVDMTLTFLLSQVDADDLGAAGGAGGITQDSLVVMSGTFPTVRYESAAVWADGVAYIFGGYSAGNNREQEIVKYDPATDSTTLMSAQLPIGLKAASAVWDGTHAYIFGGWGFDGGNQAARDEIYRYDPATDTITTMGATLPTTLYYSAAVWSGSHAYLFGGFGSPSAVLKYDPGTDSISQVASLPAGRTQHAAAWDGTYAYIVAGKTGSTTGSILRFDPATDTVDTMSATFTPRYNMPAIWDGAHVYVFGGYDGVNSIERWDPSTDSVDTMTSDVTGGVPARRMPAIWADDAVYMFGGVSSGNGFVNKISKYT